MEDELNLMSVFSDNAEIHDDEPFNMDDYINGGLDNDSNEDDDNNEPDELVDKNKPIEDEGPEIVDGDDDNEGDDSNDDDSSSNLYSSISDVLMEQGIIPSLDSSEGIKNADDFVGVLKREIELQSARQLEDYISNLDLERIATSRKAQLELDSIDEDYLKDNLEVAKDIILRDYINQGLSEDRAKRYLKKTIELGSDMIIEEALESTQSLKEFEKKSEEQEKIRYKQSLIESQLEQERINDSIKNTIYSPKPIIDGMVTNKALQDRVFKTMTEVVAKDPTSGELQNKFMQSRSANPVEFDTKMYYLYELTKGFTDLSGISKTVTSSAVKKLETVLRKTKFEDGGTPGYMQDPDSYSSNYGSELVL